MMHYLTIDDVVEIYHRVMEQAGGLESVASLERLQSALAQPRMTFGGEDLYPTIARKAATLCFSIIRNHPFVDGNKRAGHAAMEVFLVLNGYEIAASVEEQERIILGVAAAEVSREEFSDWLASHVVLRSE